MDGFCDFYNLNRERPQPNTDFQFYVNDLPYSDIYDNIHAISFDIDFDNKIVHIRVTKESLDQFYYTNYLNKMYTTDKEKSYLVTDFVDGEGMYYVLKWGKRPYVFSDKINTFEVIRLNKEDIVKKFSTAKGVDAKDMAEKWHSFLVLFINKANIEQEKVRYESN